AYRMNAVNTIVNENGVLKGYNSDGIGAYLSITGNNIDLNDKNVLIIGNGGTAKSIAYTIIDRAKINRLNILGRDKERVEAFINRLKEHTNFHQISSFYRIDDDNLVNAVQNSDIIINTSPIGMSPNDKLTPIPVKLITEKHVIFDVVYKPLKTMLLKEAEKRNATIINGLEMLINQGVVQFELWTKKKAPKTDMYDAIKGKIII
ncbi:MAG: shikimate dehydrogenase, partial [Spirochaetota bacterium]|nr:shikimate dehydrogenase [Spirochaetota bacterium]